jgi:hypothetical protein
MHQLKWLGLFAIVHLTAGAAFAQITGHPIPAPWQQADIGDVGLAGSAFESSDGDLSISGAGSDIWGTADSFHFLYQQIYDGEINTNPPQLQNTDPHAKIGLMFRLTLAPDSPHVILDVQPDGSVEFMQRSIAGGETTFLAGIDAGLSPSWYLRLLRTNRTITAIACTNGLGGGTSNCRTIGTTSFPDGPALVGAVITSHNPNMLNHGFVAASLPRVATVPDGWFSNDIGTVGLRGGSYFQNDTFIVQGAGADIWGTSDSYQALRHSASGDSTIVARVTAKTRPTHSRKLGWPRAFRRLAATSP